MRLYSSTPDLDDAELGWWRKFADVEERFCWVQTPAVQRFLRGSYVRRIVSMVPAGARIAELGCGTGWLSIMLATLGAAEVLGIDFSPEQIEKARRCALENKAGKRVRFEVGNVEEISERVGKCEIIIVHGFLHHLATTEIREVLASIYRSLTPGGHLVIWEPVRYTTSLPRAANSRWERTLQWLSNIPNRGQRLGIRRRSDAEISVRQLLAQRNVGHPPQGPSPKETPFGPGEIEALVAPLFGVVDRRRCMSGTPKVAEELLLMELSHPWVSRVLFWPLLGMARFAESRLLQIGPSARDWTFEMFDCVAKEDTAPHHRQAPDPPLRPDHY
jgi:SAM-dependent methyltransferase